MSCKSNVPESLTDQISVGLKVLATVPGAYVESEQIPQYLQYTRAIGRASGFNRGRWVGDTLGKSKQLSDIINPATDS